MQTNDPLALLLDEPTAGGPDCDIGASRAALGLIFLRELGPEDLAEALRASPPALPPSGEVLRIRHTHHTIARLMATGEKNTTISAMTGFSLARLSTFRRDPAFQELVAFYQTKKDEIFVDVHKQLARVGGLALELIEDRLEKDGDSIPLKELREVMREVFERSVAPAKSATSTNNAPANVQITFVEAPQAPRLTAAPQASPALIDITPKETEKP